MPILFICFIVFIIWFRVKSNQAGKIPTWDEEYWQKEHDANFARKKDISDLDYIKIPLDDLPFVQEGDSEELRLQNVILKLNETPIINLNKMSNADIKLQYGVANFELLSSYDQNYLKLIRSLDEWAFYLYENQSFAHACQILEYSVSIGSDVSRTYQTLGTIYGEMGQTEKIQSLIDKLQKSDFFMKDSMINHLKKILLEY